jgi:hypothetical protein
MNNPSINLLRVAWYRRVLGWQVGPEAVVFLGQHIQMSGVRSTGRKISIGKGELLDIRVAISGRFALDHGRY